MSSIDTLRNLIQHPPQNVDERKALCELARELSVSLERPIDTMHRLFWSVEQLPMIQVAIDLKLFRIMSQETDKLWTVQDVAEKANANETLTYRLMRYLSSFGLIKESTDSTYLATPTTQWLATCGAEGGVNHYQRTIAPCLAALPEVLKSQNYRNPSDPTKTAFNAAWKTDIPVYQWRPADSSLISSFLDFIKAQRAGQRSWTETFPTGLLQMSDADVNNGRVLFVDVGGASGNQAIALRKSFPDLRGKVVLQDQEFVINGSSLDQDQLSTYDVTPIAHNFFEEQPVQGARAYYLRNVMHDWPDNDCVRILQHLRDASLDDSMILIDEMVLPDTGATWKQAQKDVQMMACLAAMERSQSQWQSLLAKAGLKVQQICIYDEELGDSIIVAVKA